MTPPAAADRRARAAVSGAFAIQGFAYAGLLSGLPGFKQRFGIDDLTVTLTILGVCVAAGTGSALAARAVRTRPSAQVLRCGLVVVAIAVTAIALAPGRAAFVAAFVVYGVGLGLVDAGTNMQAVAVERRYRRSILTSCYAAWSVGGILGALWASGAAALGLGHVAAIAAVTAVVVVAAAACWRDLLAAPASPEAGPAGSSDAPGGSGPAGAHPFVAPWSGIFVLGLAIVGYYVADSAVSAWSAIYVHDVLLGSAIVAPLGYAGYLATTLVSRLAGDRVVRAVGRVRVVRASGVIGAAGLLAVVLAPGPAVAIAGFALAGLGLGVVAPLCFAAAGELAPAAADVVIARLNVFNYVGAVLGGVLVGGIGVGSTLRIAFAVPLALALVVACLAPWFAARSTRVVGPVQDGARP
ncbi:MFS transporter [Pengzhenrongella sicca]|uniref:MFS transporter n=1 Tax=Pengzhenrongella sicca TaxID=2819238 RepID=A0A8A4ZET5_9MICO|nr:MFS transporter [Pengzhenrongella sicca]QTE29815.1 MFS transporter [Pengzhenrongella sicca]